MQEGRDSTEHSRQGKRIGRAHVNSNRIPIRHTHRYLPSSRKYPVPAISRTNEHAGTGRRQLSGKLVRRKILDEAESDLQGPPHHFEMEKDLRSMLYLLSWMPSWAWSRRLMCQPHSFCRSSSPYYAWMTCSFGCLALLGTFQRFLIPTRLEDCSQIKHGERR